MVRGNAEEKSTPSRLMEADKFCWMTETYPTQIEDLQYVW